MTERLTVVVVPPDDGQGGLTVDDAMRQVLDFFRLVKSSTSDDSIVWRLVEAKTSSPPFTVTGEARALRRDVDVELVARSQKANFVRYYAEVKQGRIPDAWQSKEVRSVAKDFFHRNQNGIAKTSIVLDDGHKIELTARDAELAERAFEEPIKEQPRQQHAIFGSIEGTMFEVGTHYNQPSIRVKERISGEFIWCVVPDEFRKQIAGETDFNDVWSGRRVNVRGKIEYRYGIVTRVHAYEIRLIERREIALEEIRDQTFTGGLSPSEYINKLREGELD